MLTPGNAPWLVSDTVPDTVECGYAGCAASGAARRSVLQTSAENVMRRAVRAMPAS